MNIISIYEKSLSGAVKILFFSCALFSTGGQANDMSSYQRDYNTAYQAYIYNYPLVKNYLSIYQYAVDTTGTQYKGPMNKVNNVDKVFTPKDTGIITPNSDTPYSFLIMDLRGAPLVVTIPKIESNRYYSLQVVDLYTNNVDYIGTRNDGNGGGSYLIAGPGWAGPVPSGIKRVIHISTELAFSLFRTQLFNPSDIENVRNIQAQYKVKTLNQWLGKAPVVLSNITYPQIDDKRFNDNFWDYASFLLQFCPELPEDKAIRQTFSDIGLLPGKKWPDKSLSLSSVLKVETARKDAYANLNHEIRKLTTSVGLFGTSVQMAGKYKERALGAMAGIYGNSPEEALYPTFQQDDKGEPLDGSKKNYTITFPKGGVPPVKAFWSVTMYDATTQLLVENIINRYLINSGMLPDLIKNKDGSITLYLQHSSPGKDKEANWLPAPDGPMSIVMRLYLPKTEALDGHWVPPSVRETLSP